MSHKHFYFEVDQQGIALVKFVNANQNANVLEQEVLIELSDLVSDLSDNKAVNGMVFYSGRSNHFILGADIKDIEALANDPENPQQKVKEGAMKMQSILQKINELSFPTVCAIHRGCLGGGLELALAFDYRVLTDDLATKLSFPEVKLGLLPGAGGTQRLSRLIGLVSAIDIITSTRQLSAKKAYKIGLASAVVSYSQLLEVSKKFIDKKFRSSLKKKKSLVKKLEFFVIDKNPFARKFLGKYIKNKILKTTKGHYPAPLYALKAILEGYALPMNLGLKREARYFSKLALTSQSKALIHLYHATNYIKKSDFSKPEKHKSEKSLSEDSSELSEIMVIGGGFMGGGIATLCAYKGIKARLVDPSVEALKSSMAHAYKYFKTRVKRKRLKPFQLQQAMVSIVPSVKSLGFGSSDLVIEAVYENLSLKKQILSEFEDKCSKDQVFASNTSAIPIKDIASEAKYPQKVVGAHFFSPVEKMPLLEIVKTKESSHDAVHRVFQLGQKLGKQVIVVDDSPGFYTTRVLAFFLAEAIALLEQGASIVDIDHHITKFGFPVGPITLLDEIGIDVGVHVLDTMVSAFKDRIEKSSVVDKLIAKKILGRKNAKGMYLYKRNKKSSGGLKKDKPNLKVQAMFHQSSKNKEKTPSSIEIIDRLTLIFVNESVKCLDEGILSHQYDGDVGAVFGLGFPPFHGGPFCYADKVGADILMDKLKKYQDIFGDKFVAADSLMKMAKDKSLKFY